MAGPNVSFEVQVLADKNWVVAELIKDEAQAKLFADNLLQKGNHSAVRVVRDYRRADGIHQETVIQEKTASGRGGGPDLSLGPVSEAPLCQTLADLTAGPARSVINRLLRKYLDEVVLTPSEILHSAAEMKRLGDKGNLLFSAIDRISTLQANASGGDSRGRRDELNSLWDESFARGKRFLAARHGVPKTFGEVMAGVEKGGDEHPYLCLSMMTLRLLECRSWMGKMDILLDWADQADQGGAASSFAPQALMDGVMADILHSAQVIQDLLGFQTNLGSAIQSLADLSEGKGTPTKFAPDSFGRLNSRLGAGFAQARQVLLGRMIRELGGQNPLSRNEPSQEYEVYQRLAQRLVSHRGGVLGDSPVAEALLHRVSRIHAHLGNLSIPQAMELCLAALSDTVQRVHFLLAAAGSTAGQAASGAIQDMIIAKVRSAANVDAWVPVRLAPPDRMAALTAVNRALKTCPHLERPVADSLANHVDEVLADYLVRDGVIEKIDRPDDPLAMRALRLIKFCGSGVLIEGKSLNLARQRVIDHLRQPQFEEKFLASVGEGDKAEKHLREFHRLLIETGFR